MRKNPQGALHQIDIKGDGSGIVAITETPEAKSGLAREYSSIADIRVPLTTKQQPRMQLAGRLNDTNPFYGGARIVGQGPNGNAIECTAGWPVQGRTTGYWFLVTAAHCGYDGQYWWNGDFSQGIGYATGEKPYEDVMLVRMTGPATSPVMWDGGVPGGANTSPEFTKFVSSWAHTTPGEYLCTSGSFSGAVCNWQVRSDFPFEYCASDAWGTYECRGDMFVADQIYGVLGCRGGDSGGPVFSLNSDYSRVIAEGIMSSCSDKDGGSIVGFQDYATISQIEDVLIY
ncbi:trypsin-like serine protease [Nonomuraea fuscirosea]|uniref:trypsin-like serine protease n=1 Tax=Nonomuraea fuscirosea TaxID=1291556 RepID=UPI0034348F9D